MKDEDYLEFLKTNVGFESPEKWLAIAKASDFQRVAATPRPSCPNCSQPNNPVFGQFVYYSTCIKLRECTDCGLLYADALIPDETVQSHFETAYKDEQYFLDARSNVFKQLTALVDSAAQEGASVIDIGAAKGHLLATIKRTRPDLNVTACDISTDALRFAKDNFGIEGIHGSIPTLKERTNSFDVVLLIDVIYYEKDLKEIFTTLTQITNPSATVILRVPNKYALVKLVLGIKSLILSRDKVELSKRIYGFNPEHLYLFKTSFLIARLRESGFTNIALHPAKSLKKSGMLGKISSCMSDITSKAVFLLSFRKVILSPSVIITAEKS